MNQLRLHHAALRAWAHGIYPQEAAVELLIRFAGGRFAGKGMEWIQPDDYVGWWVDWDQVQLASINSPYSGGERRVLAIAASLGSSTNMVNLSHVTAGLGPYNSTLVLAAISHALGSQDFKPEPIYEWPPMDDEPRGDLDNPAPIRNAPKPTLVGWTAPSGALFPWPAEEDE